VAASEVINHTIYGSIITYEEPCTGSNQHHIRVSLVVHESRLSSLSFGEFAIIDNNNILPYVPIATTFDEVSQVDVDKYLITTQIAIELHDNISIEFCDLDIEYCIMNTIEDILPSSSPATDFIIPFQYAHANHEEEFDLFASHYGCTINADDVTMKFISAIGCGCSYHYHTTNNDLTLYVHPYRANQYDRSYIMKQVHIASQTITHVDIDFLNVYIDPTDDDHPIYHYFSSKAPLYIRSAAGVLLGHGVLPNDVSLTITYDDDIAIVSFDATSSFERFNLCLNAFSNVYSSFGEHCIIVEETIPPRPLPFNFAVEFYQARGLSSMIYEYNPFYKVYDGNWLDMALPFTTHRIVVHYDKNDKLYDYEICSVTIGGRPCVLDLDDDYEVICDIDGTGEVVLSYSTSCANDEIFEDRYILTLPESRCNDYTQDNPFLRLTGFTAVQSWNHVPEKGEYFFYDTIVSTSLYEASDSFTFEMSTTTDNIDFYFINNVYDNFFTNSYNLKLCSADISVGECYMYNNFRTYVDCYFDTNDNDVSITISGVASNCQCDDIDAPLYSTTYNFVRLQPLPYVYASEFYDGDYVPTGLATPVDTILDGGREDFFVVIPRDTLILTGYPLVDGFLTHKLCSVHFNDIECPFSPAGTWECHFEIPTNGFLHLTGVLRNEDCETSTRRFGESIRYVNQPYMLPLEFIATFISVADTVVDSGKLLTASADPEISYQWTIPSQTNGFILWSDNLDYTVCSATLNGEYRVVQNNDDNRMIFVNLDSRRTSTLVIIAVAKEDSCLSSNDNVWPNIIYKSTVEVVFENYVTYPGSLYETGNLIVADPITVGFYESFEIQLMENEFTTQELNYASLVAPYRSAAVVVSLPTGLNGYRICSATFNNKLCTSEYSNYRTALCYLEPDVNGIMTVNAVSEEDFCDDPYSSMYSFYTTFNVIMQHQQLEVNFKLTYIDFFEQTISNDVFYAPDHYDTLMTIPALTKKIVVEALDWDIERYAFCSSTFGRQDCTVDLGNQMITCELSTRSQADFRIVAIESSSESCNDPTLVYSYAAMQLRWAPTTGLGDNLASVMMGDYELSFMEDDRLLDYVVQVHTDAEIVLPAYTVSYDANRLIFTASYDQVPNVNYDDETRYQFCSASLADYSCTVTAETIVCDGFNVHDGHFSMLTINAVSMEEFCHDLVEQPHCATPPRQYQLNINLEWPMIRDITFVSEFLDINANPVVPLPYRGQMIIDTANYGPEDVIELPRSTLTIGGYPIIDTFNYWLCSAQYVDFTCDSLFDGVFKCQLPDRRNGHLLLTLLPRDRYVVESCNDYATKYYDIAIVNFKYSRPTLDAEIGLSFYNLHEVEIISESGSSFNPAIYIGEPWVIPAPTQVMHVSLLDPSYSFCYVQYGEPLPCPIGSSVESLCPFDNPTDRVDRLLTVIAVLAGEECYGTAEMYYGYLPMIFSPPSENGPGVLIHAVVTNYIDAIVTDQYIDTTVLGPYRINKLPHTRLLALTVAQEELHYWEHRFCSAALDHSACRVTSTYSIECDLMYDQYGDLIINTVSVWDECSNSEASIATLIEVNRYPLLLPYVFDIQMEIEDGSIIKNISAVDATRYDIGRHIYEAVSPAIRIKGSRVGAFPYRMCNVQFNGVQCEDFVSTGFFFSCYTNGATDGVIQFSAVRNPNTCASLTADIYELEVAFSYEDSSYLPAVRASVDDEYIIELYDGNHQALQVPTTVDLTTGEASIYIPAYTEYISGLSSTENQFLCNVYVGDIKCDVDAYNGNLFECSGFPQGQSGSVTIVTTNHGNDCSLPFITKYFSSVSYQFENPPEQVGASFMAAIHHSSTSVVPDYVEYETLTLDSRGIPSTVQLTYDAAHLAFDRWLSVTLLDETTTSYYVCRASIGSNVCAENVDTYLMECSLQSGLNSNLRIFAADSEEACDYQLYMIEHPFSIAAAPITVIGSFDVTYDYDSELYNSGSSTTSISTAVQVNLFRYDTTVFSVSEHLSVDGQNMVVCTVTYNDNSCMYNDGSYVCSVNAATTSQLFIVGASVSSQCQKYPSYVVGTTIAVGSYPVALEASFDMSSYRSEADDLYLYVAYANNRVIVHPDATDARVTKDLYVDIPFGPSIMYSVCEARFNDVACTSSETHFTCNLNNNNGTLLMILSYSSMDCQLSPVYTIQTEVGIALPPVALSALFSANVGYFSTLYASGVSMYSISTAVEENLVRYDSQYIEIPQESFRVMNLNDNTFHDLYVCSVEYDGQSCSFRFDGMISSFRCQITAESVHVPLFIAAVHSAVECSFPLYHIDSHVSVGTAPVALTGQFTAEGYRSRYQTTVSYTVDVVDGDMTEAVSIHHDISTLSFPRVLSVYSAEDMITRNIFLCEARGCTFDVPTSSFMCSIYYSSINIMLVTSSSLSSCNTNPSYYFDTSFMLRAAPPAAIPFSQPLLFNLFKSSGYLSSLISVDVTSNQPHNVDFVPSRFVVIDFDGQSNYQFCSATIDGQSCDADSSEIDCMINGNPMSATVAFTAVLYGSDCNDEYSQKYAASTELQFYDQNPADVLPGNFAISYLIAESEYSPYQPSLSFSTISNSNMQSIIIPFAVTDMEIRLTDYIESWTYNLCSVTFVADDENTETVTCTVEQDSATANCPINVPFTGTLFLKGVDSVFVCSDNLAPVYVSSQHFVRSSVQTLQASFNLDVTRSVSSINPVEFSLTKFIDATNQPVAVGTKLSFDASKITVPQDLLVYILGQYYSTMISVCRVDYGMNSCTKNINGDFECSILDKAATELDIFAAPADYLCIDPQYMIQYPFFLADAPVDLDGTFVVSYDYQSELFGTGSSAGSVTIMTNNLFRYDSTSFTVTKTVTITQPDSSIINMYICDLEFNEVACSINMDGNYQCTLMTGVSESYLFMMGADSVDACEFPSYVVQADISVGTTPVALPSQLTVSALRSETGNTESLMATAFEQPMTSKFVVYHDTVQVIVDQQLTVTRPDTTTKTIAICESRYDAISCTSLACLLNNKNATLLLIASDSAAQCTLAPLYTIEIQVGIAVTPATLRGAFPIGYSFQSELYGVGTSSSNMNTEIANLFRYDTSSFTVAQVVPVIKAGSAIVNFNLFVCRVDVNDQLCTFNDQSLTFSCPLATAAENVRVTVAGAHYADECQFPLYRAYPTLSVATAPVVLNGRFPISVIRSESPTTASFNVDARIQPMPSPLVVYHDSSKLQIDRELSVTVGNDLTNVFLCDVRYSDETCPFNHRTDKHDCTLGVGRNSTLLFIASDTLAKCTLRPMYYIRASIAVALPDIQATLSIEAVFSFADLNSHVVSVYETAANPGAATVTISYNATSFTVRDANPLTDYTICSATFASKICTVIENGGAADCIIPPAGEQFEFNVIAVRSPETCSSFRGTFYTAIKTLRRQPTPQVLNTVIQHTYSNWLDFTVPRVMTTAYTSLLPVDSEVIVVPVDARKVHGQVIDSTFARRYKICSMTYPSNDFSYEVATGKHDFTISNDGILNIVAVNPSANCNNIYDVHYYTRMIFVYTAPADVPSFQQQIVINAADNTDLGHHFIDTALLTESSKITSPWNAATIKSTTNYANQQFCTVTLGNTACTTDVKGQFTCNVVNGEIGGTFSLTMVTVRPDKTCGDIASLKTTSIQVVIDARPIPPAKLLPININVEFHDYGLRSHSPAIIIDFAKSNENANHVFIINQIPASTYGFKAVLDITGFQLCTNIPGATSKTESGKTYLEYSTDLLEDLTYTIRAVAAGTQCLDIYNQPYILSFTLDRPAISTNPDFLFNVRYVDRSTSLDNPTEVGTVMIRTREVSQELQLYVVPYATTALIGTAMFGDMIVCGTKYSDVTCESSTLAGSFVCNTGGIDGYLVFDMVLYGKTCADASIDHHSVSIKFDYPTRIISSTGDNTNNGDASGSVFTLTVDPQLLPSQAEPITFTHNAMDNCQVPLAVLSEIPGVENVPGACTVAFQNTTTSLVLTYDLTRPAAICSAPTFASKTCVQSSSSTTGETTRFVYDCAVPSSSLDKHSLLSFNVAPLSTACTDDYEQVEIYRMSVFVKKDLPPVVSTSTGVDIDPETISAASTHRSPSFFLSVFSTLFVILLSFVFRR